MSFFFLLISALCVAYLTYIACWYANAKISFSCIALSLIMGALTAGILFFVTKPTSLQQKSNLIIAGTSADFPPFTYIKDGVMVGFDIDLINEIGHRLNKKIELKNLPFGTLFPSLQLGNIDVIASGLTETPERAKQVLFTTPYIENNPLVIVSLSSSPAKTIQDLHDNEVVVNEGYTADLYMSNIKGPHIKRLKSPAESFLALKSGRGFAFVTAQNTIKPFFAQYDAQEFHVASIPNTEESASLAIAPGHTELLNQIQSTLNQMKEDGTLQELKNKWGL
jgi:polar amino acid transport system substrate-binding protein